MTSTADQETIAKNQCKTLPHIGCSRCLINHKLETSCNVLPKFRGNHRIELPLVGKCCTAVGLQAAGNESNSSSTTTTTLIFLTVIRLKVFNPLIIIRNFFLNSLVFWGLSDLTQFLQKLE